MFNCLNSRLAQKASWASQRSGRSLYQGFVSAASLVILSCALVGCYYVTSKPDVIGLYELKVGHDRINLEIAPDDRFTETIQWASGKVEKRTGTWRWNNGSLSFDELWIPKSFAPDYILQADAESGPNQPKYTEPGHWTLSAENHWGTVTLEIFPDADISFRMVAHSSR